MKQARMDTMNSEPVGDLRGSFLEAMSRAANSVYIVTTDGVAGRGGRHCDGIFERVCGRQRTSFVDLHAS